MPSSSSCADLYREVERLLESVARINYGHSYLEAVIGDRKLVIWCMENPLNIVADLYRVEEKEGAPYEIFIQRIEFGGQIKSAMEIFRSIAGIERILYNIRRHIKVHMIKNKPISGENIHRFSADGGSYSFMFDDFMALHHLPLNSLPEPPHRRSSPPVAW